jgi:hypothetical protein
MAIKELFIPSGTNQVIGLNLDDVKYTSALRTILGIETTTAAGSQKYPYRSIKAALQSGAIVRLTAKCKDPTGKKRRNVSLVCARGKADTAAGQLIGTTVKVGIGAGVSYEITRVVSG